MHSKGLSPERVRYTVYAAVVLAAIIIYSVVVLVQMGMDHQRRLRILPRAIVETVGGELELKGNYLMVAKSQAAYSDRFRFVVLPPEPNSMDGSRPDVSEWCLAIDPERPDLKSSDLCVTINGQ